MKNVLIVGATSLIAQEVAKCFAANGESIFLVARNQERLDLVKKDLIVRGAPVVYTYCCDMNDQPQHELILKEARKVMNRFDIVLVAYGYNGNPAQAQIDLKHCKDILDTSFISVALFLAQLANEMEKQADGTLAVIGSVAGDKGRKNYVYGSAKAGLEIFVQGLRRRLYKKNIHVLLIKPGFVDTPMTKNMKKSFLFVSASYAGNKIYRAIIKKKDILYVPWFWRFIMLTIRILPEGFYKRF